MAGSVLDSAASDRLPTAATCMHLLKLPPYRNAAQIRRTKLLFIRNRRGSNVRAELLTWMLYCGTFAVALWVNCKHELHDCINFSIHISFTCHLRHNSPFVLFTLNPTICSECQPWSESRLFSGDLALARRQSLHLCAENLSPVIIVPYNTKYIQHHWMWCSKILKKIPHCISHHHHWHSLIWIKHHKSKHCVFSNSTLATNIWLGHSAFAGSQQFKHDEGPKTTETGNKKQALLQRFIKTCSKVF